MVQIILGSKGSGKTKRLIDLTNAAVKEEKGNIIFIDRNKSYMYDLRHEVRFVDASEYPVINGSAAHEFLGFLCGMLSADYDLNLVVVDAFRKIVKTDLFTEEMQDFFTQLTALSEAHNCRFVISMSAAEDEVPDYMKELILR